MIPCTVCDSASFDEKDGYLFCKSCCTQSQNYVDMEVEMDDRNVNTTVLKDPTKNDILQLTSWEEYNYVLAGLVNQLIELGAKKEIKLVALQLWTEYLRKAEVAFFSQKSHELPRLPLAYKNKDASIMYDKDCRKVNKSKRKTTSSVRSAKLRRKRQKQIIESEYATTKGSTNSSKASVSIPIHFTRSARRILKTIMPKQHIKVHAQAHIRPNCHKILVQNVPYQNKIQHTAARIIASIMYIALNQVNDKIQLGDMMRWFREGHLSAMNIERFFPANYKLSGRMVEQMCQAAVMSHYRLRLNTLTLTQFLNIKKLEKPDFTQLCRRYVNELALPNSVFKYAERLIKLNPPVMGGKQFLNTECVPNYEGRAMAYIVFILKLIFGLNGTTEELLADSAAQINCKIGEEKLFNIRNWMHFIEMRKTILSEHHFPTKLSTTTNSNDHSHLYINYLNSIQTMETITKKPSNPSKTLESLFEAMLKIADIHQVDVDKKITDKSIKFHPSLTPNWDYFCQVHKQHKVKSSKLSNINFEQTEIDVYLNKNKLRRELREKFGISLKFRKITKKMINMNMNLSKHFIQRGSEDILQKFNRKPGWVEVVAKRQKSTKLEQMIEHELQLALSRVNTPKKQQLESDVQLTSENASFLVNENNPAFEYESIDRNLSDSETEELEPSSDFDTETDSDLEQNLKEIIDGLQPNRDLESNLRMFDNQSDDELSNDDWNDEEEEIEFFIPNFHYWRRLGQTGKHFCQQYTKVQREFPQSFNWVINECARIIENKPYELYTELLTLEAGFINCIKPLKRTTTRLKFRKFSKKDLSLLHLKSINNLWQHW